MSRHRPCAQEKTTSTCGDDMLGERSSSSSISASTRSEHDRRGASSAGGRAQHQPEKGRKKSADLGGTGGTSKNTGSNTSTWGLGSLSLLRGSNVTHRLADMGRSLVASLSPAPVESSFIEKGTLTPQEFVDAGDQLSFKFPTWQWQGSLYGQRRCSWLPPNKQYLLARSVPCYRRVREMDQALLHQEADGGWLLPLLLENDEQQGDREQGLPELKQPAAEHVLRECTIVASGSVMSDSQTRPHSTSPFSQDQRQRETVGAATHMEMTAQACADDQLYKVRPSADSACSSVEQQAACTTFKNVLHYVPSRGHVADVETGWSENSQPRLALQENAIPDISSLTDIDDLLQEEDDPAALKAPAYFIRNAPDAEIVAARTYDVSITYDKYFQTPRIWLFGYNENGVPLSPEEIFEDILTEYAAKTVTVDPHPCTGIPTASIHPCRHASVMKKVVDSWIERGLKPRHDMALLALLKFISSVMPTIEYDFTMDIDMFIHTLASEELK